jgi:hypothetical protein
VIRSWAGTTGILCLLLAASGCANFWDEALSHERDFSYMTGIGKPNPLAVIRDNDFKLANADGHRRAQALSELREPLQHGGNAKDQEAYLNILIESAMQDTDPICRLCAIRALGKFHDPRAARALEDIHKQPKLPFTPDNNHMIRKEALVALELTKDPEAWKFLVVVARGPAPLPEADITDRQQTQDEKIVAVRALGQYRQQECVDALQAILRSEKAVDLRHRALQSLEESTGKRWPGEYAAWQKNDVQPLPSDPTGEFIQRVSGWVPRW